MRNTTCCFTGHRPMSLPWRKNEQSQDCIDLKNRIRSLVQEVISCGYRKFIFGAALGVDTYVGEILLEFKELFPYIIIEAALPCLDQCNPWQPAEKVRYTELLARCDCRTLISPIYTKYCMNTRNQYMVDSSSLLIAVTNGRPGGTMNTISYAKKQGVDVKIINL